MCLAVPMKIISIDQNSAQAEVGGIQQKVNISLLPNLKIGDYVIVHAGFALQTIQEDEAQKTLDLFQEGIDLINQNNLN